VQSLERAASIDPRQWVNWWDLAVSKLYLRDYAAVARYLARAMAINDRWAVPVGDLAELELQWHGDLAAATRVVSDAMEKVDIGQLMGRLRFHAPGLVPEGPESDTVLARLHRENFGGSEAEYLLFLANWHHVRGRTSKARAYADSARPLLEADVRQSPNEAGLNVRLGLAYAFLGRAPQARRYAARATSLLPLSADAFDGAELLEDEAVVDMVLGDADAAAVILERLVAHGGEITAASLYSDPLWAPLRAHPRIARLISARATAR